MKLYKVVNPIAKVRINRKEIGEKWPFFVVYPTAIPETVLAVEKNTETGRFSFLA